MKCESKVIVTYTIEVDDVEISISHETGDDEIYIWKRVAPNIVKEVAFSVFVDEAEQLGEALRHLAIKMRHEEEENHELR